MAKEFGATSFEETSEEVDYAEEEGEPLAPKQHVKRLISAQHGGELQEYQGTTQTVGYPETWKVTQPDRQTDRQTDK
jgi:hypothetical protein